MKPVLVWRLVVSASRGHAVTRVTLRAARCRTRPTADGRTPIALSERVDGGLRASVEVSALAMVK
jgi:hypothetical protein